MRQPHRRQAAERKNPGWALLGFAAAVTAAAAMSAVGNPRAGETMRWYDRLDKPPYTPPKLVFPIAWTALYAMIAVSGWRVWKRPDGPDRSRALALWGAQLALNAAWTPIFFTAMRPRAALVDVAALVPAVALYGLTAARVDRPAGWMMAPYLAWTSFAAVLNADIVRRNPDDGRAILAEVRAEEAEMDGDGGKPRVREDEPAAAGK
ncbi:MAG TPA: TspO/MBR family protein [Longimicrobiaceae bacterium]|nr:TspO/MBR family protein [Longimicrobiaceae bacterium]